MKVMKIDTKNIITPRTTGYAATGGLALSMISGVSKNKSFRKAHKSFAWFTAAATLIHIGLIESYRFKKKKH